MAKREITFAYYSVLLANRIFRFRANGRKEEAALYEFTWNMQRDALLARQERERNEFARAFNEAYPIRDTRPDTARANAGKISAGVKRYFANNPDARANMIAKRRANKANKANKASKEV